MATVRPARSDDAAALFEFRALMRAELLPTLLVHDRIYSISEEAAFLRRFEDHENWLFLLACEGPEVVGFLELSGGLHSQTRHAASLGMAVAKPLRGQGIGTKMFRTAKAWAVQVGLLRIELEVFESNVAAMRLYESLGFSKGGIREDAVRTDSGFESLIIMSTAVQGNAA